MSSLTLLAMLAAAAPAQAPAAADSVPIFSRLQGEWRGEGTLLGRNARFTMRWERDGGFAILRFTNAIVDSSGRVTPVLHAVATYRTTARQAEGVWLDSRGVRIEIAWEAADSALVSRWTAPTESGRTTYRLRSATEIEVTDEVRSGETWRTFAVARYRRTHP